MRLRKRDTSGKLDTWALIGGHEQDVCVFWESSPPEPDVGWAGGLVLDGVYFEDEGDVSDDMSDAEMADLFERVEVELGEHHDDRGNEP